MSLIYHLGELQDSFHDFVSLQIQKDPSNYVSHDSHTFWVNDKAWKATIVRLKKLPISTKKDTSAIEKARKIEGIADFGQGPNFKDGRIRLLSSIIVPRQPLVMPNCDLDAECEWEMQCFHCKDDRVPLEFGVTHRVVKRQYEFEKKSSDDRAVNLKVSARYKTKKFVKSGLLNVVSPGTKISKFLSFKLEQTSPFLCRCQGEVSLNHIIVNLKETTRCLMPLSKGFDVQEDTRTTTLRDTKNNGVLDVSKFKLEGAFFTRLLPKHMYNFRLPNIGPTFHSENCSRTYALEVKMVFECDSNKSCRSEYSTLIDIDVAIDDVNSDLFPPQQAEKGQEFLSFQTAKLSPSILSDVESLMARWLLQVSHESIGHHASATAIGDSVLVTTTVFIPDDYIEEKTFSGWRPGTKNNDPPELLLIPSKEGWKMEGEGTCEKAFFPSEFLAVFDYPLFLVEDVTYDPTFNLERRLIPGRLACPAMYLSEVISIRLWKDTVLHENVEIVHVNVELQTQEVHRTAEGKQVMKTHKRYIQKMKSGLRLHMKRKGGKRQLTIPDDLLDCLIPIVPPSLLSNTMSRAYFVCVEVKVKSLEQNTCHELSTRFDLPIGKPRDLLSKGQPPPYQAIESETEGGTSFESAEESL